MATETIILRPNSSFNISSSIITPGGATNPTTEDIDKLWTLLSEETPDDDSTYIQHTNIFTYIAYGFVRPPEKYINKIPTKISIYLRAADKKDENKHHASIGFFSSGNETLSELEITSTTVLTSNYQTCIFNCPQENLSTIYNLLLTNTSGIISLNSKTKSSGTNKSTDIRFTQLYLELEYSDGEDEPTASETIYLKQNGSWSAISGDIYKKENGIWVLKDASILQQGLKYKINSV